MANYTMKEVDYRCTNPECRHNQTLRYFPDEPVNPVLCCIKCRAGFNVEPQQMLQQRAGMMIVGKPRLVDDEPKFRKKGVDLLAA